MLSLLRVHVCIMLRNSSLLTVLMANLLICNVARGGPCVEACVSGSVDPPEWWHSWICILLCVKYASRVLFQVAVPLHEACATGFKLRATILSSYRYMLDSAKDVPLNAQFA